MQAVTSITVTGLQKRIVKALETGQDPAPLLKELGQLRARIAAEGELAELQKIASERQALKNRAEAIKVKVQKQGEAIDALLKARDTITEALSPILELAKELPKLQEACYEHYHDSFQFGAEIRQIPKGYLSSVDGFSCPMLEMAGGLAHSYDKAAEAIWYMQASYGLLANLTKGKLTVPEKPAGEFDGELEAETSEVELNCRVCSHKKVVEINKLLKEGRSLRDIESEFNVSRSTLSRHKNRCLNLGAIRIVD